MKSLLALWVALIAFSSLGGGDMQTYLQDTQEIVRRGDYPAALKRFIWFHDHALEHEPAMYGVRLSFALLYWKDLGDLYPQARTALIETRDRKEKMIKDGMRDHALFHDVAALNRTLKEDERTVVLFEWVDNEDPESAKVYWDIAKDVVIAAKRYDLARKYIGNPTRSFSEVKALYDQNTTHYGDPQIGGEQFKAYNENSLVEESLKLIEVALALGDENAAREIQAQALAIVEDYRLRDAVSAENEGDVRQDENPAE